MSAASIEVEQLTLQEGVSLLLRWTKLLDLDAPLAQAQAAYVEETGCSLEDYLRLYATHRKELLARHSRLMLDYPETVATTWSLSFQRVEHQSPAAADVLRLCAFLAPDAIPEELLTRGASELALSLGLRLAIRSSSTKPWECCSGTHW